MRKKIDIKSKKENSDKRIALLLGCFLLVSLGLFLYFDNKYEGAYDYCVEWEGLNDGTLYRDNLLYTCYSLSTNTFYCDYEILDNNQLVIKPISNIIKNEDGEITSIEYAEANTFNCTKWLKSKEIKDTREGENEKILQNKN